MKLNLPSWWKMTIDYDSQWKAKMEKWTKINNRKHENILMKINERNTSSWISGPLTESPRKILPWRAKLERRVKLVCAASRSFSCSPLVRSFMILIKMPPSSITPTKKSSSRSFRELRFFIAFKFLSVSDSSPGFPGEKTLRSPWTRLGAKSLYLWWSKEQIFPKRSKWWPHIRGQVFKVTSYKI